MKMVMQNGIFTYSVKICMTLPPKFFI